MGVGPYIAGRAARDDDGNCAADSAYEGGGDEGDFVPADSLIMVAKTLLLPFSDPANI